MAHFIKLAVTRYDDRGEPSIGADDYWINLDQITAIEEHLGNNLFHKHNLDEHIATEHYPCLLITSSDGHQRLTSLGTYPDVSSARRALDTFLPALVDVPPDENWWNCLR